MKFLWRISLLLTLKLFILSCANNNDLIRIFPEYSDDYKANDICSYKTIAKEFIVQWQNGSITLEKYDNKDLFVANFLKKNIEKIRLVEYNKIFSYIRDNDLENSFYYNKNEIQNEITNWGQYRVKADILWKQGFFGNNIKIAILDSGVDTENKPIQNQLLNNELEIPFNDIDDDKNGYIDDYHGWNFIKSSDDIFDNNKEGHGTHVTAIIASNHNLGPIKGIAPKAKIIPIKFLNHNGEGTLSNALAAIKYAIARKAQIINASWGDAPCSLTFENILKDLERENIFFVSASGNDGFNIEEYPIYPAAFNLTTQITVGASNYWDQLTYFSNFSLNKVHLLAPGSEIESYIPYNQITIKNGTSMATPFVSGAIALLLEKYPNVPLATIKEALIQSTNQYKDLPVLSKGILNISNADLYIQQL